MSEEGQNDIEESQKIGIVSSQGIQKKKVKTNSERQADIWEINRKETSKWQVQFEQKPSMGYMWRNPVQIDDALS